MSTDTTATNKKVSDVYSELAHYTSASGLKGILESQCLWASHARFLNDSKEIDYFFEARCATLVTEALVDGLRDGTILYQQQPASCNLQAALDDAPKAAVDLTNVIRKATLAFNQPHVLSLCGIVDAAVARDGLLSQWRAYGRNSGYALIFDTKRLEARLEEEHRTFHYQHLQIGDVHYHNDTGAARPAAPEIQQAETSLRSGVQRYAHDPRPETLEDLYIPVTMLCCLYKHWGFHEEHEVRVVAIPAHASVLEESIRLGETRRTRDVKAFLRDGYLVPYIELLSSPEGGSPKTPLPVTRILVGPHRDADRRKAALDHMLKVYGLDWPVETSKTPYLETFQ